MLTYALIDRKLLENFKRRSLRVYPKEFALAMWGKIEGDGAHVYALLNVKVDKATTDMMEFEVDTTLAGMEELAYLGSLHSHPDSTTELSEEDKQLGDPVVAVCAIHKRGSRRFSSFAFYEGEQFHQLELVQGEGDVRTDGNVQGDV